MTTDNFFKTAKSEILKHLCNENNEELFEVIPVWYCKTIQNHKGLFIIKDLVTGLIANHFIEATYHGDIGEMYLDDYQKVNKFIIKNIGDNT